MNIPYRHRSEYQPVDLSQLRPGQSYAQLIAKRTHPIDELVRVHGRIPDDLLRSRPWLRRRVVRVALLGLQDPDGDPEQVPGRKVTWNFFSVLR